MFPLLRAWVRSLVGELRSHKPQGAVKKKKKKKRSIKAKLLKEIRKADTSAWGGGLTERGKESFLGW